MAENTKENSNSDLECNENMSRQGTDVSLSSSPLGNACGENDVVTTSLNENKNLFYGSDNGTFLKESINNISPLKRIFNQEFEQKIACKKFRYNETDENGVPLPLLQWASNRQVWEIMMEEEKYSPHAKNCFLYKDSTITMPHNRICILEWLTEVCEKYQLRRVTYHLAVDYIDRFLAIHTLSKCELQLLGVASLFLAAKVEEIHPPSISDFCDECDGACSLDEILDCEIILLNALDWDVNPLTATVWLNLYMQIYYNQSRKNEVQDDNFFYPQYSGVEFVFASHLIDFFTLDLGFVLFRYNVIAATAMFFLYGKTIALKVSLLDWEDIQDCVKYMAAFHCVVKTSSDPKFQSIACRNDNQQHSSSYKYVKVQVPHLTMGEHHILQTVIDVQYFEKAMLLRLRHMGFHIYPIYIKKTCSMKENHFDGEQLSNTHNNVEEVLIEVEPENRKFFVRMFEVRKISVEEKSETVTSSPENQISNINQVDCFTSKTRYTFDELLIEINKFNKEIFLSSKSTDM
ncbi:hypothetical protein ILUMI_26016 [Ignelater luminosus]|uniref:Uncharacterized protein n=1 Tax=Ignelater luminosus TaxID=2038154 RepID=A0A8K0FZC5_IGNLU|nr:hypothetical protein ILUMI_26016 [Ignelater luminosus]